MSFDPQIGKLTQWRRGEPSPNPAGRPRDPIRQALRAELEGNVGLAGKLARAILQRALDGDVRAFNAIADRIEGKPQSESRQENPASITVILG